MSSDTKSQGDGGYAENLADEILSMMLFSDIHDNPMHPFRDKRMMLNFRNKFPFNKPNGINTSVAHSEEMIDQLITLILTNTQNPEVVKMKRALATPIVRKPMKILSELQGDTYQEEPKAEAIPNEIFYNLEEVRKIQYPAEECLTEEESETKAQNFFVHDKLIFDSFSETLRSVITQPETPLPWEKESEAKSNLQGRLLSNEELELGLQLAKTQTMKQVEMEAGTKVIPPPPINPVSLNGEEPKQQTDDERLQSKREERLNHLLTYEIGEEDKSWAKIGLTQTQVRLDLADMILEELTAETAILLGQIEEVRTYQ